MLNRRFLRIKAFQALYGLSREEGGNATQFRERMLASLDKTFGLYLYILYFPVAFRQFLLHELEVESSKFIPSDQHIELLKRLISNKVAILLEQDKVFEETRKKYKVMYSGEADLMRKIYNELKGQDLLKSYMERPEGNFAHDKTFVTDLMEWICSDSELFDTFVEENYPNWEDDQVLVLTTLQKTLQFMKESNRKILPEKHKDEAEDLKFVKNLYDLCLAHETELMAMIASKTQNWDQDRIALVDMILMKMALCELIHFPFIPVKVTINEYLQLAKLYSTPNSHGFINGILDKIQLDLKKENRIQKLGRGLVD